MFAKKIAWHLLFWGMRLTLLATIAGAGLAVLATYDAKLAALTGVKFRSWCAGVNLVCLGLFATQFVSAIILGVCDPKAKPLPPLLALVSWILFMLTGLAGGAISTPQTDAARSFLLWTVRCNGILALSGAALYAWTSRLRNLPPLWRPDFSKDNKQA